MTLDEPARNAADQIDALLSVDPRDCSEERESLIHAQPELALKRRLARELALRIIRTVGDSECRICRRVPRLNVNPVEDSEQIARPRAEISIQPTSVCRR